MINTYQTYTKSTSLYTNFKRQRKVVTKNTLSFELRFIAQFKNNGKDCGVLICLHIWAILTGKPPPNVPRNGFDESMETARIEIGQIIS